MALAQGVGGVSATANPIANSSGSVTNQAIQVLQGPYITNTYGGGVQCQGSTLNLTPYIQFADSRKHPWEDYYLEPQYDLSDFEGRSTEIATTVRNYPWEDWYDDRTYVDAEGETVRWFPDGDPMEITIDQDGPDGIPDNPGKVIWKKPVRTDMRANQSFNLGLSATLSIPVNRKFQKQCHEAAAAQISMQQQLTANKRLDFELARLKNCGQLMNDGIRFHPKSRYAAICADVIVTNAPTGRIPDHTHKIPTSSSPSATPVKHDSGPSEQASVPEGTAQDLLYPGSSSPYLQFSSQQASRSSGGGQQEVLRAVQKSAQLQRLSR